MEIDPGHHFGADLTNQTQQVRETALEPSGEDPFPERFQNKPRVPTPAPTSRDLTRPSPTPPIRSQHLQAVSDAKGGTDAMAGPMDVARLAALLHETTAADASRIAAAERELSAAADHAGYAGALLQCIGAANAPEAHAAAVAIPAAAALHNFVRNRWPNRLPSQQERESTRMEEVAHEWSDKQEIERRVEWDEKERDEEKHE